MFDAASKAIAFTIFFFAIGAPAIYMGPKGCRPEKKYPENHQSPAPAPDPTARHGLPAGELPARILTPARYEPVEEPRELPGLPVSRRVAQFERGLVAWSRGDFFPLWDYLLQYPPETAEFAQLLDARVGQADPATTFWGDWGRDCRRLRGVLSVPQDTSNRFTLRATNMRGRQTYTLQLISGDQEEACEFYARQGLRVAVFGKINEATGVVTTDSVELDFPQP
jgi:hypothetical protein